MADHIKFGDYLGDINLGFHGVVTSSYAVLAPKFSRKEFFDVDELVEMRVSNTDLLGLFMAGNSNGLLVPDIVSEHEISFLEEKGVEYKVVNSNLTALGNLVLVNDNGCIISEKLSGIQEEVSELFGVPVKVGTVAGTGMVGSAGFTTNNGVLIHRECSREELEFVEEVLDVKGDIGTVNFGSPYVGTGLIGNSEGIMVGNSTTGPETARIEKALGFLK